MMVNKLPDGLVGLGLALALSAQSLRPAATGYVKISRSGQNNQVYAEQLITQSLFQHSRNPLYLGNLLILGGLFLIHNSGWVYAVGERFFWLTYGAMVAAEEEYLRSRFGAEYAENRSAHCVVITVGVPPGEGQGPPIRTVRAGLSRARCNVSYPMIPFALQRRN